MVASFITPTPPQGTAEYPTGGEATNFVVPLSGCLPGDVLVVNVTTTTEGLSGAALTVPGDVTTLIALGSATSAGISGGLYWYTVPSSPPANLTFVWAAARRGSIAWAQLRPGAGGTLTNNAFAGGTWSASVTAAPTAPSITTTQANCYILAGTMYGSGSATTGVPAGFTLRTNATQREGTIATKGLQASAGASGAAAFDTTSSGSYIARAWQLAVYESGAAAVPIFQEIIQGKATDTGQVATIRAADATSAHLRASTTRSGETLTGTVVSGSSVTPAASGWCRATLTGLTPDTAYYLQARLTNATGTTDSPVYGPFYTAPVPGTPKSFSVLFGGDLQDDQSNPLAFTNMAAAHPDAVLMFSNGDTHNGDNVTSSQASHRADWENILATNAGFRSALRNRPFLQAYGDHDPGGGNNGIPGFWTAPNIAAYQEVMPYPATSPALPSTTNWSVVHGRVRIISPDYVHERTSTYKLGATQMAWLEAELAQPEPLKVLLVGGVWYDQETPEGWPGGDGWADYAAHRAAIQALIEGAVGTVLGVHGDQHAIAAMSAAGNPFGGFPVVGGSPWSGWSSHKGDVVPDSGRWPLVEGVAIVHQYGKLTFDDNGDYIVCTFQGYDDTNTVRASLTFGTEGYVAPAPIAATSTASLTTPADRWVKGVMRPVWYDATTDSWRAILPTSTGHRFFALSPGGGGVQGAVVDARQDVRVTAWHHEGTTYVLRVRATAGAFSVYSSALGQVGSDVALAFTGITDNDAQPVSMLRSPNGHLWAAWTGSGAARVLRSTDNGATWTVQSVVTQAGIQGVAGLALSGTTVVLLVVGNDGLGRWVRSINQDAASHAAASWSTEGLPALASPLTSDDHLSMVSLPDGRIIAATKTTGSTTGAQPLLYSLIRSTSGGWTQQLIQVGPDDDPGWTRPSMTCDAGQVVVFYGNYAGSRELVKRTTPSDSLGTWSERAALLTAGDFSDSPVVPGPGCIVSAEARPWPVLAHDRATEKIWLLWQGVGASSGGDLPLLIEGERLLAAYADGVPLTAIYVGTTKVF